VTWYTFFKSVHVIRGILVAMLVGIAAVLAFYARGAQQVQVPVPAPE
jgi:hypothetical protein